MSSGSRTRRGCPWCRGGHRDRDHAGPVARADPREVLPRLHRRGAAALKALGSVFGGLSFIPTGGIGPANVGQYLALPQVAAVGGSWMVPSAAIDAGDTERIASLCAEAVAPVSSLSTLNHDGAS
ncbi:beta/alpha barrel domain-containing protein [Tessaracoccus coleopterorum]|uniref:hypothetical protein n=1 Tax=Tessaracoccus coleopterorum TaxID=2714950 RepID=UPI0022B22E30|nr:hypothetical protein [Tessaracoccus coleopterorum]